MLFRREVGQMLTVLVVLVIAACVAVVLGAINKLPWWVSVGILCFIELIRILPLK